MIFFSLVFLLSCLSYYVLFQKLILSNLPIFCEFPIGAYEALEIQMKINR